MSRNPPTPLGIAIALGALAGGVWALAHQGGTPVAAPPGPWAIKGLRLSEHFTLEDLTRSSTAVARGISNRPDSPDALRKLRALASLLEQIQAYLGRRVLINSAYRSNAVNVAVDGAKDSQHTQGEAADIRVEGMHPLEVFELLRKSPLPLDQVIYYPPGHPHSRHGHVHVSFDPDRAPRREFRQALASGGSRLIQRAPAVA